MIEIRNLYKRYHGPHGGDWVLRDINLTIPTGVSVGVVGRNGAGKSTLLRLIGGMDAPDRGEVIRHGRVSWPIGLAGGFKGAMTGRQNVKFVARIHGVQKRLKDVIQEVEAFAELGRFFDEPVTTYSSGMRSRLAFGLSLAFDFDIYISDEATAVGDRSFKAKAREAFQQRIGSASLIMVSHGEGALRQMCQAGIFLEQGRAQWFDHIGDAIAAYHDVCGINGDEPDEDEDDFDDSDVSELRSRIRSARGRIKQMKKDMAVIDYRVENSQDREEVEALQQQRGEIRQRTKQLKRQVREWRATLEEQEDADAESADQQRITASSQTSQGKQDS